jgi:hypothetical protein
MYIYIICICKYVYAYMCIYIYVYMNMYMNMYICKYICTCIYKYMYMHVYICICIYVYSFLYLSIYTFFISRSRGWLVRNTTFALKTSRESAPMVKIDQFCSTPRQLLLQYRCAGFDLSSDRCHRWSSRVVSL